MRILVNGFCGHMGREVVTLAKAGYCGASAVCGVDVSYNGGANNSDNEAMLCVSSFDDAITDVDCIVDFSHHLSTAALLDFAVKNKLPLVLATTGQTEEEKAMIYKASESIPLFFAANYSLGVALLIELAKKTAAAFPDAEIEIIEKHHNRKVDAPSGTALAIAQALCEVRSDANIVRGRDGYGKREKNDIGIHAIRMGNIVGEHEVIVGTQNQTITLKHEAHSRALFAEGALSAAAFLVEQKAGLYDMKSMIEK